MAATITCNLTAEQSDCVAQAIEDQLADLFADCRNMDAPSALDVSVQPIIKGNPINEMIMQLANVCGSFAVQSCVDHWRNIYSDCGALEFFLGGESLV